MKSPLLYICMLAAWLPAGAFTIKGPDGRLALDVELQKDKYPVYSVSYDGHTMLRPSPLGLTTNIGEFGKVASMSEGEVHSVVFDYELNRIKKGHVKATYNSLTVKFTGRDSLNWSVEFLVGNNDIAFRYLIPKEGETGSIYIESEATGFRFPRYTTTFLCPQSDPMIGWKRTKPSYEEEYAADAPMDTTSMYGHGYTFPCLFKVGDDGWVLVSETGVDSHYCASHLSDYQNDGLYTIAYPMPGENNGNGNTGAAVALPAVTPWRTITVGQTLAPIVETTVPWDVVTPLYEASYDYKPGHGTWSWILWQDDSINFEDQKQFIDLAAAMGYEYVLIDNWWDNNIGRKKMADLVKYAAGKNVKVILWYSSSGYWNDIEQGPINYMDNPIVRKREMRWLRDLGVAGIKVDFFGGDKQETMRLYESILSDADDNGLMVIFHGCTLPRGWERMYPNYMGSEAVLASENIYFQQHFADEEAFNATLHPFIRNTVGSMEFGGTFMNRRLSRDNKSGNVRRTTDAFELATAVLFQNPIQNFAITPNNLKDAPAICMDFLREVPTTWTSTKFIEGYPGKYVVLLRTSGDKVYMAGINATDEPIDVSLRLYTVNADGKLEPATAEIIADGPDGEPVKYEVNTGKKPKPVKVTMQPNGGFVAVK